MADEGSIAERVRNYFGASGETQAKKMARLSSKAVAVVSGPDETDVYFDIRSYQPTMIELWDYDGGNNHLFPDAPGKFGLGVLPGKGVIPPVGSYLHALEVAKQQLLPLEESANFLDVPVELE